MSEEVSSGVSESVSLPTESEQPSKSEKSSKEKNLGKNFNRLRKPRQTLTAISNSEHDLSGVSKKGRTEALPFQDGASYGEKDEPKPEEKVEVKPEPKIEAPKVEDKPTPPIPAKEEPRKFKVRVNGEEREVTQEVLLRDYQLREASDQRFREAAEIDKRNRALLAKANSKEGIFEFLQAFGHDPKALAEEYLADVLNYEMMTPEQKRIRQLEIENQRLANKEKQIIEAKQREEDERVASHFRSKVQKDIIGVLDKSDLPVTAATVKRMARHMEILVKQGIPAEPKDVLDDVRNEIINENKAVLSSMTPEQLVTFLGKEKLDEYRKHELSQIKNPVSQPKDPIDREFRPQSQKKHYKTMEDFKASQRRDGIRR